MRCNIHVSQLHADFIKEQLMENNLTFNINKYLDSDRYLTFVYSIECDSLIFGKDRLSLRIAQDTDKYGDWFVTNVSLSHVKMFTVDKE